MSEEDDRWKPLDGHTIQRTDTVLRDEHPVYTVRWAHGEELEVLWVNFAIFEVLGVITSPDGTQEIRYGLLEDHAPLDDATPLIEGFVKWDGCTQYHSNLVHIDDLKALELLFETIKTARKVAAEMMPGTDIFLEYDL